MLHTLAVENYRSLRSIVVPLGRLNVIQGANGSGKSNLYKALRLLADNGSRRSCKFVGSRRWTQIHFLGWTRENLSSDANRTSSSSGHAAQGRRSLETWWIFGDDFSVLPEIQLCAMHFCRLPSHSRSASECAPTGGSKLVLWFDLL